MVSNTSFWNLPNVEQSSAEPRADPSRATPPSPVSALYPELVSAASDAPGAAHCRSDCISAVPIAIVAVVVIVVEEADTGIVAV